MKLLRRKGINVIVSLIILSVLAYRWVFPPSHLHCMKQAIFIFLEYAEDNDERFPQSEKGWGDALLKLGESQSDDKWIQYVVGIDDDGSRLRDALANGSDVDEKLCTRVYMQGLTHKSYGSTAILFDRDSEPGGDHFRSRFRAPVREVLAVDGTHKMIEDGDWLAYVEKQRRLLRDQGFEEERISEVYGQYK